MIHRQKIDLDKPIRDWFPDFEEYIACDGYAEDIRRGASLNTCIHLEESLRWYATYVVCGRWLEAERYIIKHVGSAMRYARFPMKNRWLEAEPYIMKEDWSAKWYTRYVIEKFDLGDKQC